MNTFNINYVSWNIGNKEIVIENESKFPKTSDYASKIVSAVQYICDYTSPYVGDLIKTDTIPMVISDKRHEFANADVAWFDQQSGKIHFVASFVISAPVYEIRDTIMHEMTHYIQLKTGATRLGSWMRPFARVVLTNFVELCGHVYGTKADLVKTNKLSSSRLLKWDCEPLSIEKKEKLDNLFLGNWARTYAGEYTNDHILYENRHVLRKTESSCEDDVVEAMRIIADAKDPEIPSPSTADIRTIYRQLLKMAKGKSRYVTVEKSDLPSGADIKRRDFDALCIKDERWQRMFAQTIRN